MATALPELSGKDTLNQERITGGCNVVRCVMRSMPRQRIRHCRVCQKQFGNYFGSFAGVDKKDFEVTRGRRR
jgi:hypothetical protein